MVSARVRVQFAFDLFPVGCAHALLLVAATFSSGGARFSIATARYTLCDACVFVFSRVFSC